MPNTTNQTPSASAASAAAARPTPDMPSTEPDNAGRKGSGSITAEERRKSRENGIQFASLTAQKRNVDDPYVKARRDSFNDQRPDTGFFGKWWNTYTKGPGGMGSVGGWGSTDMVGVKPSK